MTAVRTMAAPATGIMVLVVVATLGFAGVAASTTAPTGDDPVEPAIDAFLTDRVAVAPIPGLAVAVTEGSEVMHLGGYGTAGDGRAMSPDIPMRIASLSKSFTAMAVLDLAVEGRIDLDAPVRQYVPSFALDDQDVAAAITVRHLLHQTSGLADRGFPGIWDLDQDDARSRVEQLRSARPVDEPGSAHRYFNPNYEVLALVVEEVTGRPLGEHIETKLTSPLEMADTLSIVHAEDTADAVPDLAVGHLVLFGRPVAAREPPGFVAGSAGIVSTARDLGRWVIAHEQGGRVEGRPVLSAEAVDAVLAPGEDTDHPYAMGWWHTTAAGHPAIVHDGMLATSSAYQMILPETGHGIVLLANGSHAFTDLPAIAEDLAALVTDGDPPSTGSDHRRLVLGIAALIVIGVGVRVAGVVRRGSWAERRRAGPAWRRFLGIARLLLPLVVLAALPTIIGLASGRVFTHRLVALAAPELVSWLAIASVTGLGLAVSRVVALRRIGGPRPPDAAAQSAKHSTWMLSGSRNANR